MMMMMMTMKKKKKKQRSRGMVWCISIVAWLAVLQESREKMGCLSRFVSLPRLSASLEVGLGYVNNCLPRKLGDAFLAEEGFIFQSRFLSTPRSPSLVDFLDLT
jgi:hypothetical protein